VLALTLLALAVLDVRRPLLRPLQRVYAAVAFAALATGMLGSLAMGLVRIAGRDAAREYEQARLDELVAAVRRHGPPGASLYVMSYTIGSGFPLVNYSGARWASRFPHLWIVEAVYHDRLYDPRPLRYHPVEAMGPAERYLNTAVYEDLSGHRPDLLLVLRHARDVPRNSLRRIDYVGYFSRDPRIAAELARYRLVDEVGQYLVYVRAGESAPPGAAPGSEPGRYDVARSELRGGGEAMVADRAILLSAAVFLLLALGAYRVERRKAQRSGGASSAHA
jgi:hypothetical protein